MVGEDINLWIWLIWTYACSEPCRLGSHNWKLANFNYWNEDRQGYWTSTILLAFLDEPAIKFSSFVSSGWLNYLEHQLGNLWWANKWPEDCSNVLQKKRILICVWILWYSTNNYIEHDNKNTKRLNPTRMAEWVRNYVRILQKVCKRQKSIEN